MSLWRTWLYVPAQNTDRVRKAFASDADCVILDLEDSVPAGDKEWARKIAMDVIAQESTKPVLIRINAIGTPWHEADLAAIARVGQLGSTFHGIRIPKAEDPAHIRKIAEETLPKIPVHLLIESALGVANLQQLSVAHPSVVSISLGEADLRADLAWTADCALDPIRIQTTIAARSANLMRPPASVFTHITDTQALIESTQHLKSMGFFGRSVIHPQQINAVNVIFTPTAQELDTARQLIAEVELQAEEGKVAFTRVDGSFIDPALVRQSHATLDLEKQITGAKGVVT